MERCHVCRKLVAEEEICRRVMPVSQTRGVTFSASPGFSTYVHEAVVSLCPACFAAEEAKPLTWSQRALMVILLWLGWGVCTLLASALVRAVGGLWMLLGIAGGSAIWTMRRRRAQHAQRELPTVVG